MFKSTILLSAALLFTLFITSCGTSTGSRYERNKEKPKEEVKKEEPAEENIDLSRFRTKLVIEDKELKKDEAEAPDLDVWYGYDEDADTGSGEKTGEIVKGYRVQVLSTDNLEEANSLRSEIYFKTNQKPVYVIFDPPFYKVRAGDFTSISDANDLNFKLTQMGYNETRVVSDSVNVYR